MSATGYRWPAIGMLWAVIVAAASMVWLVRTMIDATISVGAISLACFVVLIAMLPPLAFDRWLGQSVAGPLATMAWRLGILLPGVLYSSYQIDASRKCFQVTLLACYFIALPLESWLLIRQSRP